ncbi:hypothetical protein JCM1840_002278 [Sporobolomyces johnsonii]
MPHTRRKNRGRSRTSAGAPAPPPAPPPSGAARFQPSQAYLASVSKTSQVAAGSAPPPAPSGSWPPAPPSLEQDVLNGVLASLSAPIPPPLDKGKRVDRGPPHAWAHVAQPSTSFAAPRPAPAPAAYYPLSGASVPNKASWPPRPPPIPAYPPLAPPSVPARQYEPSPFHAPRSPSRAAHPPVQASAEWQHSSRASPGLVPQQSMQSSLIQPLSPVRSSSIPPPVASPPVLSSAIPSHLASTPVPSTSILPPAPSTPGPSNTIPLPAASTPASANSIPPPIASTPAQRALPAAYTPAGSYTDGEPLSQVTSPVQEPQPASSLRQPSPPPASEPPPQADFIPFAFTSPAPHPADQSTVTMASLSDQDSDDEAVIADALVRDRHTSHSPVLGLPDQGADSSSESGEETHDLEGDEADEIESIANLEDVIQPVPEDDDDDAEQQPFEFDMGSEEDEEESDLMDGEHGDEDRPKRKRCRVDSLDHMQLGYGSLEDDDLDGDHPDSRTTSRAPSIDPAADDSALMASTDDQPDRPTKPLPQRRGLFSFFASASSSSSSALTEPSPSTVPTSTVSTTALPAPSRASGLLGRVFATSTPSRLSNVLTAPQPDALPSALFPGQDEEMEEGELSHPPRLEYATPAAARSRLPSPFGSAASSQGGYLVNPSDSPVPVLVAGAPSSSSSLFGYAEQQHEHERPSSAPSALDPSRVQQEHEQLRDELDRTAGPGHEDWRSDPFAPSGPVAQPSQRHETGAQALDVDADVSTEDVQAAAAREGGGAWDEGEASMEMSFADLPADLVADITRRPQGAISIQPLVAATASAALPPNGKGVYQRRVDLSSTPQGTPVAVKPVVRNAPAKLSYMPSPLSADTSLTEANLIAAGSKGVYVRRQPLVAAVVDSSVASTATHSAPPSTKAVYERPAGAIVPAAPVRAPVKPSKAKGALPLTAAEKSYRLPVKFHALFPSEFPTLESATSQVLFAPPSHSANPSKSLPPPNEKAQWGFWPAPPTLKAGKAVFPAPLIPVDLDSSAANDPRPRVDVFIDNSNVFYSFLNWVRARPDAKVINKVYKEGGAGSKNKSVKVLTLAGKKAKMDYGVLFALLERGRKVERRVLVGSSPMWQSLDTSVDWGYEVSLLQRVPRTLPTDVVPQPTINPSKSKKRDKSGKLKTNQQQQQKNVKHYKEQAVDELVHLKILESLLDYTPPPFPPRDESAAAGATPPPSVTAPTPSADAPQAKPTPEPGVEGGEATPAESGAAPEPAASTDVSLSSAPDASAPHAVAPVPSTPVALARRDRPTLVIATGDANSSEYNPGGFLGCVRRALDRGWDVEICSFSTHGLSSSWAAEQRNRVTKDGRERGELRIVNLEVFAEELVM